MITYRVDVSVNLGAEDGETWIPIGAMDTISEASTLAGKALAHKQRVRTVMLETKVLNIVEPWWYGE